MQGGRAVNQGAPRSRARRAWLPVLATIALSLGAIEARAAGPTPAPPDNDDESVDVDRALSEPPEDPSDVARASAARLYNEGMASARKGRAKEALACFRAAYEQDGSPEALANMAAIEAKLGRPRAAAEHLAKMLQNLPSKYAGKVDDLKRRLADQAALVGSWRVEIATEGEVYCNGKWVGAGPFTSTLYVEPGSHVLRVQVRGVMVERTVQLEKGEVGVTTVTRDDVAKLVAKLPSPVAPPPPAPAASKAVLAVGTSLTVAFSALGFAGVGVAVHAANERAAIDDGIRRFGGSCPASSPGFADDCFARDEETGNETAGKILTAVGFAGAGVTGLGTLLYATSPGLFRSSEPAAARVQIVPAPGGIVVRGVF